MICNKCGAEIKDTLKFCNRCGAKIQLIRDAESPRTEPLAIVGQTDNVVVPSYEASSSTLGQQVDSDVIKAPPATVQLKNEDCRRNENDVVSNTSQPKISRISISGAPEVSNTPEASKISEPKSKMLAGILAIFLGFIGVQWFYLGRKTRGVVYIAISFLMSYILPFLLEFFILFYVGEGIFFIVSSRSAFEKYTMRKQ